MNTNEQIPKNTYVKAAKETIIEDVAKPVWGATKFVGALVGGALASCYLWPTAVRVVKEHEDLDGLVSAGICGAIGMVGGFGSLLGTAYLSIQTDTDLFPYLGVAFVIGNGGSALYETGRWFKGRVDKRIKGLEGRMEE